MFSQDGERSPGGVCIGIEGEYEREVGEEIEAAAVCYYLEEK